MVQERMTAAPQLERPLPAEPYLKAVAQREPVPAPSTEPMTIAQAPAWLAAQPYRSAIGQAETWPAAQPYQNAIAQAETCLAAQPYRNAIAQAEACLTA